MSTAHNKQACHWRNGVKERGCPPKRWVPCPKGTVLKAAKERVTCTIGDLPG